jgi:Protein of unknown function (DUF4038)/Putative collagen-binding domain of a collagenase
MRRLVVGAYLAALAVWGATVAAVGQPTASFLVNGDFERGTGEQPANWSLSLYPNAGPVGECMARSQERARSGEWSLRIDTASVVGQELSLVFNGGISGEAANVPGGRLEVSGWVYIEPGSAVRPFGMRLRCFGPDEAGKNAFIGDVLELKVLGTPGEWTEFRASGRLPGAQVTNLDLHCSIRPDVARTVQFLDDIAVGPPARDGPWPAVLMKAYGPTTEAADELVAAGYAHVSQGVSVSSTLPRLRVSSNGRYLETEDGQDFFWLGNMPWLPVRISRSEMSQYLDARQAQGHTAISVAAHNFALHNANNPLYNGEGAFGQFGPVVLNEAYWTYIDWIVDEAAAHNLYVALAAMWGYDADTSFNDPYQDNYDYGYFLGQRYGDRTNVIFVAAGEFINIKCAAEDYCGFSGPITPEQKALLRRIADGFRDGSARHDPDGKILVTLHGTTISEGERVGGEFHDDAWVDFYLEQTWSHISYTDEAFTFDWNLGAPIKPALQGETGFWERSIGRPGDPADPLQAWEQRLQGYWSVFYGSCGTTYSSFFWDNIPGDFDLPGAWDMRHLKDLILSRPMRDYVPDQSLITSDTTGSDDVGNYNSPNWGAVDRRVATRAANKTWAMFYTTQGKAIGVRRSRLANGTMSAYWYNPRNGLWNDDMGSESSSKNAALAGISTGPGAGDMTFDPPGGTGPDNDWVLVLE